MLHYAKAAQMHSSCLQGARSLRAVTAPERKAKPQLRSLQTDSCTVKDSVPACTAAPLPHLHIVWYARQVLAMLLLRWGLGLPAAHQHQRPAQPRPRGPEREVRQVYGGL